MLTRTEGDKLALASKTELGEVHWLVTKNSSAYSRLRRITYSDLIHYSINDAIIAAKATQEDEIKIVPGYTETITGIGGLDLNKTGVKIKGLGGYSSRPTFLMDGAATVTAAISAADIHLENCLFKAGHADVATWGLVTAKGFKLINCGFAGYTTDENFVAIVTAGVSTDNAFDGLEILDCVMDYGTDDGALSAINLLKNSNGVRIIGNRIYGDFDTSPYAVIYSVNTEVHKDIDIGFNKIHNLHDANALVGISVGSVDSTGFMHDNMVYGLDVAAATPFVSAATGIALFNNLYNFTGSTSQGYQEPAIGVHA